MKVNDLLSQASAPTPSPLTSAPMWSGKPLVHADHAPDLDRAAAVYEMGADKLPRAAAEDRAHADYKKRQHVEAAAHHLGGMKAAVATGDIEAARKHGVMYELHSKALGHDTVGPAHPEVAARLARAPLGFQRFKAHRGDLFAVPEKKEETVTKAEILHGLYKTLKKLHKGADTEGGPYGSIPGYSSKGDGPDADEEEESAKKGEPDPHGEHFQLHHTSESGKSFTHPVRHKTEKTAKYHAAEFARKRGGSVDVVDTRSDKVVSSHGAVKKGEMSPSKPRVVPCVCKAYPWGPHRAGGGKCRAGR